MDLNKFFTIGYIRRVIGIKGEMGIKLEVDNPARYKGLDAMLLVKDANINGVELTQALIRGEELVVKIKGITTPEDAKQFVGSTVMLPLEALPKLDSKRFYFHEIPGFKVVDEEAGEIGAAHEVMDRMMQPVLVIKKGYTEILIPLADGVVKNVDRENKTLHIAAPAGLIDLYLEKKDEEEE
jgi:16S rRNA processing protein RimM